MFDTAGHPRALMPHNRRPDRLRRLLDLIDTDPDELAALLPGTGEGRNP